MLGNTPMMQQYEQIKKTIRVAFYFIDWEIFMKCLALMPRWAAAY